MVKVGRASQESDSGSSWENAGSVCRRTGRAALGVGFACHYIKLGPSWGWRKDLSLINCLGDSVSS